MISLLPLSSTSPRARLPCFPRAVAASFRRSPCQSQFDEQGPHPSRCDERRAAHHSRLLHRRGPSHCARLDPRDARLTPLSISRPRRRSRASRFCVNGSRRSARRCRRPSLCARRSRLTRCARACRGCAMYVLHAERNILTGAGQERDRVGQGEHEGGRTGHGRPQGPRGGLWEAR